MSEPISSKKPDPQYFQSMSGPTPPAGSKPKPPAMKLDAQPTTAPKIAAPPPTSPGLTSQCIDVGQWPTPLLEKNAKALQLRMVKDPKSVSAADQALLLKIEAELSKRFAKEAAASPPPPAAGKGKVEICERPADLPGNGKLQLNHWWLKTPNKEVGMGQEGGGIPGHKDGPSGYPGVATTLNDHKGEVPTSCHEIEKVDVDCVERELIVGKSTGRWLPPFNDCHTVVADIVMKCKTDTDDPFAYEHNKESDAGVP